ncbi:MAG: nitroreductase family protein [Deltaproteobacteria bacterium]|nr:nitroreductase family protein [Deltaproteobacteria bacterium]
MTHRRTFLKSIAAGGAVAATGIGIKSLFGVPQVQSAAEGALAAPVYFGTPTETILNSRISYHSVGDSELPDTVLSNVLWAAAKAPVVGNQREIYIATKDGVFRYDEDAHSLVLHTSGNHMSEPDIAFEVAVAGDSAFDAGAALHFAHLASHAFWSDRTALAACCTKESAAENARKNWNITAEVQMANCYGRVREMVGLQTEMVATASDDSLPKPQAWGETGFEATLDKLTTANEFTSTALSDSIISQLLWAAYGCTPHKAAFGPDNSPAGLTVASAVARYYLTEQIYVLTPEGVYRYYNRLPDTDTLTRDHRLVRLTTDDLRSDLLNAVPELPEGAPAYFLFGAYESSVWSKVEAGFAAASLLLQATAMGLCGAVAKVTDSDAVRTALSLPEVDIPLLSLAAGAAQDSDGDDDTEDGSQDPQDTQGTSSADVDSDSDSDSDSDANRDTDADNDRDSDTNGGSEDDTSANLDNSEGGNTTVNAPDTAKTDSGDPSCNCNVPGTSGGPDSLFKLLQLFTGKSSNDVS